MINLNIPIGPCLVVEQYGRNLRIINPRGVDMLPVIVQRADLVQFATAIALVVERILREHPGP